MTAKVPTETKLSSTSWYLSMRSRTRVQAESNSLALARTLTMESNSAWSSLNPGRFSAQRNSECSSLGDESKWSKTARRRAEPGSIPDRYSSAWSSEPGEMDGLVKSLEMREKSWREKSGGEESGSAFGFGFGAGFGVGWGIGGSEGQSMIGFPGMDSHDEEEERRCGDNGIEGIGFGLRVDTNKRRERNICRGL